MDVVFHILYPQFEDVFLQFHNAFTEVRWFRFTQCRVGLCEIVYLL
jgi:hypothetical protein